MLILGIVGIITAINNMNKIVEEADFVYEAPVLTNTPIELLPMEVNKDEKTEEVSTENIPVVLEFIMPADGDVTKKFSGNELVYSDTMNDYRTHSGIDIISEDGTTVVSSESGKITNIENHPLWGTSVYIEHANGYSTCYKNLSCTLPEGIEVGSYVSKGGIIGVVGSTALVEIGDNPHLHFEMYVNGSAVDPTEYIA